MSPDSFEWVGHDVMAHSPDAATDAEVRDAVEQAESTQLMTDGGMQTDSPNSRLSPNRGMERMTVRLDSETIERLEEIADSETTDYANRCEVLRDAAGAFLGTLDLAAGDDR